MKLLEMVGSNADRLSNSPALFSVVWFLPSSLLGKSASPIPMPFSHRSSGGTLEVFSGPPLSLSLEVLRSPFSFRPSSVSLSLPLSFSWE